MIGLTLAIVQVPFWVYLIKVSFDNLKKMVVTAKAEARKAAAQKKKGNQVGLGRVVALHRRAPTFHQIR